MALAVRVPAELKGDALREYFTKQAQFSEATLQLVKKEWSQNSMKGLDEWIAPYYYESRLSDGQKFCAHFKSVHRSPKHRQTSPSILRNSR